MLGTIGSASMKPDFLRRADPEGGAAQRFEGASR
jgi:hypothetical protein